MTIEMQRGRCYYSHSTERINIPFNIIDSCILKFNMPSLILGIKVKYVCKGEKQPSFISIVKVSCSFIKKAFYWIM